jgi:hypothetical protein
LLAGNILVSAGAGNWAAIAALVVFDTLVTVAACRYFFRHT